MAITIIASVSQYWGKQVLVFILNSYGRSVWSYHLVSCSLCSISLVVFRYLMTCFIAEKLSMTAAHADSYNSWSFQVNFDAICFLKSYRRMLSITACLAARWYEVPSLVKILKKLSTLMLFFCRKWYSYRIAVSDKDASVACNYCAQPRHARRHGNEDRNSLEVSDTNDSSAAPLWFSWDRSYRGLLSNLSMSTLTCHVLSTKLMSSYRCSIFTTPLLF